MLNGFEKETLLVLAQSAGAEKEEILKQLDERLSFRDNKRVLKRWLKDDGRSVDLRTELIKEKEMGVKAATESKKKMDEEEEKQYKIIEKQKTEITKYIQENKKNIMNEIVKYNPHCENITYTTLMSVMNAKDGNQKTNVINKGKQGIGKSRGTTELVRKLNISDAVIINGHITPKKLFETLRENMYATVILDESEATLSNPTSLFILRSALYGGKVQWLSSKGDLLDSYNFQGTLIANLNYLGINRSEEHTSELQSHSFISYAVFCLKKKNNYLLFFSFFLFLIFSLILLLLYITSCPYLVNLSLLLLTLSLIPLLCCVS